MCDVMPTISEDSISQRSSQFGDEANFEQLMVSMLDERDKLVESLKNEQEKTSELEQTVKGLEKERDFYFSKLRDIEVLAQEHENDGGEFVQKALAV